MRVFALFIILSAGFLYFIYGREKKMTPTIDLTEPLSKQLFIQYALDAGFSPNESEDLYLIATCESSLIPNKNCLNCLGVSESSFGLLEINILAHPEYANLDLYNPQVNISTAYKIYKNEGWNAWHNCAKKFGLI